MSALTSTFNVEQFSDAVNMLSDCKKNSKKIIILGNGGSSAIASHAAVDFLKVAGLRTLVFSDPAMLTCFANDFGYENCYAEFVKRQIDDGDCLVLISSSGQSANIINAAKAASDRSRVMTFSGFDPSNPLREMGEINFWVNSSNYNWVENTHQAWLLMICDALAAELK